MSETSGLSEPSRREFIKTAVESAAGLSVAAQCCLALSGCGRQSTSSALTPTSGVLTLPFTGYPNLQNSGGAYQVSVNTSKGVVPVNVFNVGGTVAALSAVCTHAGCTVGNLSGGSFTCPCHGSVYNTSGQPTTGPATSALTSYTVSTTSTGVEVSIS